MKLRLGSSLRGGYLFSAGALLACASCSTLPDEEGSTGSIIEQHKQPLYLDATSWTDPSISVCWTAAGYETEKAWIRKAVEQAFEGPTGVDFTWWRACGEAGAEIAIDFSSNSQISATYGSRDASNIPNMHLNTFENGNQLNGFSSCYGSQGTSSYTGLTGRQWDTGRHACLEMTAVQQFLFILGIRPEQNRTDAPNNCSGLNGVAGATQFGYWDLTSLSNGCNPAWLGDGLLSPLDVSGVISRYGESANDQVWFSAGNVADYGSASVDRLMFDIRPAASGNSNKPQLGGSYLPLVADFDGDGFDDIYFYGEGTKPDYNWWGKEGRVGFDKGPHLELNLAYTIVAGEFGGPLGPNDEHYADIFVYRPGSGEHWMFWSQGNRTFSSTNNLFSSLLAANYKIVAGDFDNNQYDDLFFYNPNGAEAIRWANGGSSFNTAPAAPSLTDSSYEPFVGDFDGDQFDDIFLYVPGSGTDYIRWGQSGRTFGTGFGEQVNGSYDVGVGDFDGDGADDILWSSEGSGGTDSIWLHTKGTKGAYSSHKTSRFQGGKPFSGDFDGDDLDDVLWYEPGSPTGDEFVHPGVLVSQEQLEAMRDRYAINGQAPNLQNPQNLTQLAYREMTKSASSAQSSLNRKVPTVDHYSHVKRCYVLTDEYESERDKAERILRSLPFETQEKGPQDYVAADHAHILIYETYNKCSHTPAEKNADDLADEQKADIKRDVNAAYFFALRWVATGDEAYAKAATYIVNDWADTFKSMKVYGDVDCSDLDMDENCRGRTILASWAAPMWATVGEILRHFDGGYPGWRSDDIILFEDMLTTLAGYAGRYIDPLVYAYEGTEKRGVGAYNNRGLSAALAYIAVGVFKEERDMYETGVSAWQEIIPEVIANDGTLVEFESRMDCSHAQYTMLALSQGAETAWHQGDDLYSYRNGSEYMSRARLELGLKKLGMVLSGATAVSARDPDDSEWRCKCTGADGYDVAYNHYKYRAPTQLGNLGAFEEALDTCPDTMTPDLKARHIFLTWSSLTHGNRPLP